MDADAPIIHIVKSPEEKPKTFFEIAIKKVLLHEGGFTDDHIDNGEVTNRGISLRWLRSAGIDIDNDGDVDFDDVKNLTLEQAKKLYYDKWWKPQKYDKLDDVELATKMFDMSINMGTKQAIKIVQTALNEVHLREVVKVDGVFGLRTVMMLNKVSDGHNLPVLMGLIRRGQADFYKRLIKRNPALKKFANGWAVRAAS